MLADSERGVGGSAQRSAPSIAARTLAGRHPALAVATAENRPTPEIVLIGAKRGGTTTVWRQLASHPGVLPTVPARQKIKGTYYLADEFQRGDRWYRSHFPTVAARQAAEERLGHPAIALEASPYYLFHPPGRRIVLASPVPTPGSSPCCGTRSSVRSRTGRSDGPTAPSRSTSSTPSTPNGHAGGDDDLLRRGVIDTSFAHRHQTYIGQGRYARLVEQWLEAVGDRLEVWISEEHHLDPAARVDALLAHFDLPAHPDIDTRAHNSHPGAFPDDVRRRLEDLYLDEVRQLERLLGRSLPWTAAWSSVSTSSTSELITGASE